MNGWTDDIRNYPVQCFAQTEIRGTSYMLYLRFRGSWQGYIVTDAVEIYNLARRSSNWSGDMLAGCQIQNLGQAKLALISIFKKKFEIKYRVKFTSPRLV